jgi:hypothetical protein
MPDLVSNVDNTRPKDRRSNRSNRMFSSSSSQSKKRWGMECKPTLATPKRKFRFLTRPPGLRARGNNRDQISSDTGFAFQGFRVNRFPARAK